MRGPRLDLLTASAICFASATTSTQAQLTDANATIPSLVISQRAEPVTLYSSLDLPTVDAPFRTFATEPTVHHASPLYRLQKRTPAPGKDLKSSPPVTADAEPFEKKPYTYTIPSARQLQHDKEDALMEYLEVSRLPLTAQDEAAKARLKDKLDLANTRWAAVVSKSPRIAKKLEVHHRKKAEEHWEGTNGGINLAAMRRHDAKSIAWEKQGKQWADEMKASDTMAKQVMRKHLKIGVMEPPPSRLRKRAPVKDGEGSSGEGVGEPLLKYNQDSLPVPLTVKKQAKVAFTPNPLTRLHQYVVRKNNPFAPKKNSPKILTYTYRIPGADALRKDLERITDPSEKEIALAKLAAVEKGDVDAAKKVLNHYEALSKGVYKNGEYDTSHPNFSSLYRNHVIRAEWKGRHASLASERYRRQEREKMEKQGGRPALIAAHEADEPHTSKGRLIKDFVHLHKRAPMHHGEGPAGNSLNEPLIKKEEGSSQSSWAATLMKPITNWQEQAAREKAADHAMKQKWSFPSIKALQKDLEAKKGTSDEHIARAKVAAVKDENIDAARAVMEHHSWLSEGVHDKNGALNKQHPDFPSFYEHHIQHSQWKGHHDALLGKKNAQDFMDRIHREHAEREAKKKKEREELLQGSSQTSKHKPEEGSTAKGGQTKVLERVHLHKRAPARDLEASSGSEPLLAKEPTDWKATLAKPFHLMQGKYQEYVAKGEARAAEKIAKGKNVAQALRYRYQIPNVDELREDYEKKAGGRTRQEVLSREELRRATTSLQQPRYGKDYIAMARLSAIEDGNAHAAREVYLHHTAKSEGLFNKDGLYNTDHPQFASLYKNKIKAHRWEHIAGHLAAIEVGRSQMNFREKRKAAEERLKKEGKGMLNGRGAALAPDHKAVGQNRADSEPMAIHLHKRAPMHIGRSRPVDENGEPIVKHESTGSLAMTNAAVEDGKNSIKNTVSVHGHAMAKTDKVMDHTQSAASAFVDKTADIPKKSSGTSITGDGAAEKPKRWEDYTYSIPPLNVLMNDLQKKVDDHSRISEGHDEQLKAQRAYKVAVAKDRVQAVALGDPKAAGNVEEHNGRKAKAVLPTVKTAGDTLNTDHPEFLTFHKNYLKHTAWAELRENLTPKKEEKSVKGQEKPMSDAIHLHKRAPMVNEKGATSKKHSGKKAVPWEDYKYEIPPAEELHQDLQEKERDLREVNEGKDEELQRYHANKVAIAKDRIDAVENRIPEAARRVQDHHGRKREALTASIKTNDGFNSEHASFPSFHKNHMKETEWEQLQRKLAFDARQKNIHLDPETEATDLHKRDPMFNGEDLTLKSPTKKAVSWQEYHYEIPSAADLDKDLHKKGKDLRRVNEGDDEELKRQHTSKVAVAQDRLDAVDNRNPDAAKRVQDHHEHKQEALATSIQSSQDPNSKHTGVHSFVKNYLKQLEWEDLQKDLAGEQSRKNMHSEPEPEAETKANALYKRAPMLSGEESSDEDAAIEPLTPVEEPKTMYIGKKASYSIPPKEVLVQDAAKKQEDLRRVMKGISPMEKQNLMNKEYLARARVAAVVKGHSGAAGVVHSHHGSKAKQVFHQLDQIDDPNFGTFHKNGKKAVEWGALRKDLEQGKSKAAPSNEMMHRQ